MNFMRHNEDILHFLGVEHYEHCVCLSGVSKWLYWSCWICIGLLIQGRIFSLWRHDTLCTFDWLCMTLLFVIMYGDTIEDTLTSEFLFLVYEYVSLYVVLCAFMWIRSIWCPLGTVFGLYVFGLMYILTRFCGTFSNREYVFVVTALLCTSVACYVL